MNLDDLAIKHKADKSSRYHNFAPKYDALFRGIRESAGAILEIGVGGGQSIRMWADYFPNAIIHGADIVRGCQSCELYSTRIKFHQTDQSQEAQLEALGQSGPFDLIIDDGNHFWREQIISFKTLFKFVKPGGMYVVEDACTSYWQEYKNNPISCVDFFKRLVDEVNLNGARGETPQNPPSEFGNWSSGWHRREDCQSRLPDFESIHFLNSIIVIHKRQRYEHY